MFLSERLRSCSGSEAGWTGDRGRSGNAPIDSIKLLEMISLIRARELLESAIGNNRWNSLILSDFDDGEKWMQKVAKQFVRKVTDDNNAHIVLQFVQRISLGQRNAPRELVGLQTIFVWKFKN